jgi:hypothetical protein
MERWIKKHFCHQAIVVLAVLLSIFVAASAGAEPWKFGVMADTQWTAPTDPAGKNPTGVAVSIIEQVNQKFIDAKAKFVIQVGDLTERGNAAAIATRAAAAEPLYQAGIGFFPMRGNHEGSGRMASTNMYTGLEKFPQTRGRGKHPTGRNFNSPKSVSPDLDGMSYSFDYGRVGNSVRFVIVDNWATPSKRVSLENRPLYGYSINDQQPWISSRLDKRRRTTFLVFSHRTS